MAKHLNKIGITYEEFEIKWIINSLDEWMKLTSSILNLSIRIWHVSL